MWGTVGQSYAMVPQPGKFWHYPPFASTTASISNCPVEQVLCCHLPEELHFLINSLPKHGMSFTLQKSGDF